MKLEFTAKQPLNSKWIRLIDKGKKMGKYNRLYRYGTLYHICSCFKLTLNCLPKQILDNISPLVYRLLLLLLFVSIQLNRTELLKQLNGYKWQFSCRQIWCKVKLFLQNVYQVVAVDTHCYISDIKRSYINVGVIKTCY